MQISWEQRKLGDIADSFEYGLNAAAKEFDGQNKYIRITDIDDTTHEFLQTDLTSPDTNMNPADNYRLSRGDILLARTGASVGKTYIYKETDGLAYYAGFLIRARIKEKYDPEFVFQNTLTPAYENYIRITSQRSGQPGVNAQEYAEYDLMVPSLPEQRKIGAVLQDVDNLITLHQSKCYGRLRHAFLNTTISWEQRKVGDITIESTEYTTLDAGYPLLTSSRAGLMYQNEYRGNLTTDSKETLFSVVPIGACTYRHMSDDDVFHLNINTLEKGLVSREYPVFFATKENCLNFIIQYINSSASFRAFCAEQKKGGTRTRLYYNALCEFKMMVPSKREQEVIAGYFLSLDHLITLHHRKLNRTQICINRSFIYGSF